MVGPLAVHGSRMVLMRDGLETARRVFALYVRIWGFT